MPVLGKLGLLNARASQAFGAATGCGRRADSASDSYRAAGRCWQRTLSRMCGAAGCAGGWTKPWKTRQAAADL